MKVKNIRQKVRSSAGAAAVAYDDDSAEDHSCSKYFLPGQMIHSYDCMLVGDEDEQLTEPELEMVFSECGDDDAYSGIYSQRELPSSSQAPMVLI